MTTGRRGLRGLTRAGVAAAAAAAVLATGCGVPTSSDVQYVGPGPERGSTLRGGGVAPPLPDEAGNPQDQVDNFLQAAAGSPDTAADRVREYLSSDDRERWEPDEGIRVIRLRQTPFVTDDADGWVVQLDAQPVGQLHPNGYLDAPASSEPVEFEFRLVSEGDPEGGVDGQGLRFRVADPPPYLLLQDTALTNERYYHPHSIYFWDSNREVLVPDLRWLPLAGEPADQQPWRVVQWLLAGPAPGLPRIEGLPAGTAHIGTPVWEQDRLVVNFNAAAIEGQSPEELAAQLARSLLRLGDGEPQLELRIDDRPQHVQGYPAEPAPSAARYVVLDGMVRQYGGEGDQWPAVLAESVNNEVQAAAVTADGEAGAFVRELPDGRQQLTVAEVAGRETDPQQDQTDLVAEQIGQPVWAGSGDPVGLVVADGQLYRFWPGASRVMEVSPPGLSGPITAVAVAPEQRRLAVIAGDRLYLAQLRFDTESVVVQAPRVLSLTVGQLAGVAFTHENVLVVAGEKDRRMGLHRVTVDGGMEEPLHDLSNAAVASLVAHPIGDSGIPRIMYEANDQAYTFAGVPSLIRPEDLVDPPETTDAAARAPFFVG